MTHELSTNTTRARYCWKQVILGADTIEIQTEERNGLLLETSHGWSLRVIPRDHTEVVGEDSGRPRLIRVEVVDDGATRNKLKTAVRVLEVQLREPVDGLVLLNATGGTLRFPKVIRRGDFDSKVRAANDPVDMTRDRARVYDGVSTFNDNDVRCCTEKG